MYVFLLFFKSMASNIQRHQVKASSSSFENCNQGIFCICNIFFPFKATDCVIQIQHRILFCCTSVKLAQDTNPAGSDFSTNPFGQSELSLAYTNKIWLTLCFRFLIPSDIIYIIV